MSSPSPAAMDKGLPREAILRELIEAATQAANPQIDGFTSRLADALQREAAKAAGDEAELCRKAAELLRKNRYPFYYVVASRLSAALEREALPEYAAPDAMDDLPPLAPDLEVDKKLCLIKASRAIEREHAERLGALNVRMAALLGRDSLDTAHNPFRPHVYLSVLHDAWREFHPEPCSHHLVFRLLGPDLCLDLGKILHALNTTLSKRGIGLQPEPEAKTAAAANTASKAAAPADNDPLLQQLRRLFPQQQPEQRDRPLAGAFPSLFQDEVLQATSSRHELLGLLAKMQDRLASLLPSELRRETQLSDADDAAISLVGKIFGLVRDNLHLPEQLKNMILSLHLPVLRVALTDNSFFFRAAHPARRAVELLVRMALGWDRRMGETDPMYPLFARSIERIVDQADNHIGVFEEVTAELDAFIKREQTATEQALAAPIAQALKKERTLQAQRAAKHEVALRIGTGEVAAFVETFLEDKWVAVLTLAFVARDEKPQAVDSALRTMDELVWSVKPKITAEERKELLGRLPPLIAMLNKWLNLINWNDESRVRFFAELAKTHASLVRAPLDMSPQRQVELALEAAQRAAERREQLRLAKKPEPVPDGFDDMVMQLQSGAWIAFRQGDAGMTRLKLAWISPMRNLYLFATRDRKEALSLSAEQLAQALREKRAQLVPAAGLVGRALAEALGVDSANAGERVAA